MPARIFFVFHLCEKWNFNLSALAINIHSVCFSLKEIPKPYEQIRFGDSKNPSGLRRSLCLLRFVLSVALRFEKVEEDFPLFPSQPASNNAIKCD
jgi:hypothetical protein